MADRGDRDSDWMRRAPEPKPALAFALTLAGGLLTLVNGVFDLWVASVVSDLDPSPLGMAASGLASLLGGLALLFGLILLGLGVALYRNPDSHVGFGIAILVLALIGFLVGGGFYVGSILGVIAGIAAIVFSDELDEFPLPQLPSTLGGPSTSWPGPGGSGRSVSAPLAGASTPPSKVGCASCGLIQVRSESNQCPRCGARLAPG